MIATASLWLSMGSVPKVAVNSTIGLYFLVLPYVPKPGSCSTKPGKTKKYMQSVEENKDPTEDHAMELETGQGSV